MYAKAIMSILNGSSIDNFSHTNTTTYLQSDQTMASEETETILIVIVLSIMVLLWVGNCVYISWIVTTEYGSFDYDENVETSIQRNISKDNLSGNLKRLQNRREYFGSIYEDKLSDASLP